MAHNTPNPDRVFYSPSYRSIVNNLVGHASMFEQCAHAMTLAIEAAQSRRENEIAAVLEMIDDLFNTNLEAIQTELVDFQMLVNKAKTDEHHKQIEEKRTKTRKAS